MFSFSVNKRGITLYKAFSLITLDLFTMQVFGSEAYVHVLKRKRGEKLTDKDVLKKLIR